jgi:prepilin-type processing-associated H-X9-DG protein
LCRRAEYHYAQTGIYFNRTIGRNCHHRIIDGDTDAGAAKGPGAGQGHHLQEQPASNCLGADLYAEAWDSQIPRGKGGGPGETWYMLFMPYLAQRAIDNDYRNVKIYRCPSYPDTDQTVCYVVNGWEFRSETDVVGYQTEEPTPLSGCRNLASTIYLADNEYGNWRPMIKSATDWGTNRCDVWHPGHLPTSNSEHPTTGRRVARDRHKNNGCNNLFLDWHIEWIAAEKMTINMWRF